METVCEVSSKAELAKLLAKEYAPIPVSEDRLSVVAYFYDTRTNWNTYLVAIEDFGVAGFTDGPLPL
jgi:hypothetical protein